MSTPGPIAHIRFGGTDFEQFTAGRDGPLQRADVALSFVPPAGTPPGTHTFGASITPALGAGAGAGSRLAVWHADTGRAVTAVRDTLPQCSTPDPRGNPTNAPDPVFNVTAIDFGRFQAQCTATSCDGVASATLALCPADASAPPVAAGAPFICGGGVPTSYWSP